MSTRLGREIASSALERRQLGKSSVQRSCRETRPQWACTSTRNLRMKYKVIHLCALALSVTAPSAFAKLPAPTPAAQATAADAAARTAWSAKVETYQLCKSQDQVAAQYRAR